jgi:ABC-type amino acid transport substrate-binding protein
MLGNLMGWAGVKEPWIFASSEASAGTLQDVKSRGKLIAGVMADTPPFGYLGDKRENKGFDVDVAKALAKELFGDENAVKFVAVTPENRILFLTSRKVDVILADISMVNKWKEEIDFSLPYFISGQLILTFRNSKIIAYQDLRGKRVATIQGSAGDVLVQELVPTAVRIEFQHDCEALQALREHWVEAFVQDFVTLLFLQKKNPDLSILNFQPFSPIPCGLGVRKGDSEWLNFINATLTKMKETGEYEKLMDKWFGRASKGLWRLFLAKK